MLKLPKVLNADGDLIDINHPLVKRGLNPDLKCPDPFCQAPVIARKGQINQPHFAHKSEDGCTGYESMMHLLAKEVLRGLETFQLPPYTLYFYDLYPFFKEEIEKFEKEKKFPIPESVYKSYEFSHCLTSWDKAAIKIFPGCKMELSQFEIFVEKPIKEMTPDLRFNLSNTDRNLHLEVLVTHKVDEVKKKRLIESDLCFLELDFSHHFKDSKDVSQETVHDIIVKKRYFSNWIHFPKLNKFLRSNRESILKEMYSRIEVFHREYTMFKDEILMDEVMNLSREPRYEKKLLKELKKRRGGQDYLCITHSEIFFQFVSLFKKSEEFRNAIKGHEKNEEALKDDFTNRWGEEIYYNRQAMKK